VCWGHLRQRHSRLFMNTPFTFFAVGPKGVEPLIQEELRALGASDLKVSRTGVYFKGDLETGYRACLWLRTASRVLLRLCRFPAETPEALYEGVGRVRWSEHLAPDGSFAVDVNTSHSAITHSRYGTLKVKDAIVDQFRAEHGTRPSINLSRPHIRVNVYLLKDQATLSLDLSGESLHRRGYREEGGPAPLKENLAAAILLRAGWPVTWSEGGGLMDPMTGSGTLPIEAAWMAGDVAPGLLRDYFGFLSWKGHRPEVWEGLLKEARERRAAGLGRLPPIVGYDADARAVRSATAHVERAGLRGAVHVERRELAAWVPHPAMTGPPGLAVINPPYGRRLGEIRELAPLYAAIGSRLKAHFRGWRVGLFTGNAELGKGVGLRAERRYSLYNGPIECKLLNFRVSTEWFVETQDRGPAPARARDRIPLDGGAEMFANRLRKNLKRLRRRFRKEGVFCFRVYDRDLPEYAVAVDIYENWVHVQEYKAPDTVDSNSARRRLREALAVIQDVLAVPREDIFLKVRRYQKGKAQYPKQGDKGDFHEVREADLRFLVNFTDYLDTGLFLDQRMTRGLIRDLAKGKRFLNLFCYTGTATVAAGMGGALSTTSVDASGVYLEWARRNLALNGLDPGRHLFHRADVLAWLKLEDRSYDLIFVDPPTFSNSKRFQTVLDVQRDHVSLIRAAACLLKEGGTILFSTNYRRFRLDREGLKGFRVEDLSQATLPRDFERQSRMHRLWRMVKGQDQV
jgi:23S rRNA (guanine2445-N2)-methyltransferase / 23S rRNA (guanine2069-N7)-methyltransferase